jgi:hypothetical protein
MLTATAEAVASLHMPNIAIYSPSQVSGDYISQEIEKLFLQNEVKLSDNKPENLIRSPISMERSPAPRAFLTDDLLDWDARIEVAPLRPAGTLNVTLEYGGRGAPTTITEPWD